MQNFIMEIISNYGYLGITFLILIENIFPPIPSELILTFAGFITTQTKLTVMGMTVFSTVGSCLGAVILYGLGRLLTPEKLSKFVDGRLGKRLHLKNENIDKSRQWFLEKGNNTVFFCRFIPIVRSMISIPAGMAGMKFGRFMILTVLGSFAWNIVLVSLGAVAGEAWKQVLTYANGYSTAVKVIILAVVAALAVRLFLKHYNKKKKIV